MKMKHSYKRKCLNTLFVTLLLLGGIFTCLYVFSSSYNFYTSMILEQENALTTPPSKQLTLTIHPGGNLSEVATVLSKHGFIKNPLLFLAQGYVFNYYQQLQPGTYTLSDNLTPTQILDMLTQTSTAEPQIHLTIPEGSTLLDIAQKVEALDICTKNEFIQASNALIYDFDFLYDIPDTIPYRLEGYLFPDTYFLTQNSTPEEIITMMLRRFDAIMSHYTSYLEDSPYTLHEVLTIASIIENEARVASERPLISGVIYNRLNHGMKLQMCSTVQYSLENRKSALTYEDLKTDSPYNTYKLDTLPIGPISCPGEAAIKAALSPSEHDYLYFVLKDPTSGTHAFSRTGSEHLANKQTYESLNDPNFVD